MKNKTAIITGGSRGIGLAVARELLAGGANITVFSTRQVDVATLFPGAQAASAHAVSGDLSIGADRECLVKETLAHFGRIDVLVNNAGVAPAIRADLLDMSEESWDRVMGINAKGTMFLTQLVAREMLRQPIIGKKRGTIINITSCSSYTSSVSRGEYCVSKAGVSMLTQLYADRLANDGIYVHEIRPGIISTDMTEGVRGKYDALIGEGAFPIARWGSPEDVALAVAAFCGDSFLYTTGNVVDVDGGFHIRRL
ncbi:MAG: 3-ketoacyl-ACP reductase [Oscillospiraceae bacterium]|nr:3-ketoacyl-ACP reductase [Oscillospiraceae bacterium]